MIAPIVADEDALSRCPDLALAQLIHRYEHTSSSAQAELQAQIIDMVRRDNMAPFYEHIVSKYGWTLDESLLSTMK